MNKNTYPRASVRKFITTVLLVPLFALASIANAAPPAFSKSFNPATIGPGSVSTLQFLISNDGEPQPAQNLAFSDNLPSGVTIASPANASSSCTGAMITAPAGGTSITMTDGAVGANSACTVSVDVTSSTPGTHMNVSGNLTSDQGTSSAASADLVVATDRPGFSKLFSPSSVLLGGRSILTFTIDNSANTAPITFPSFTDNLPAGMEIASPSNAATTCSGSTVSATPGSSVISLGGFSGSLAAGASCTVSVDVIATGIGNLGNISGDLTSTIAFQTLSSGKASATLTVTADTLSLVKSFTDDPVAPSSTVNLEFTISNRDRFDSATSIAFTDDLNAVLAGLAATGLPMNDMCGSGSQLSGTSNLSLTGGTLAPGASCTFSVTLQVPGGATEGAYLNTTSSITGNIGGAGVTGSPASETLYVQAVPVLSKSFTDDPVAAGGTVTLEFTVTNPSPNFAATNIAFIDELTTFLPFPVSVTLPAAGFCGAGSAMALVSPGTDRQALSVTGADLPALGSCTFSATIDIPVGFPGAVYTNTTDTISATIDGTTRSGNPASDTLSVVGAPRLNKQFTDDPVSPGGTVTLEFTLSHDLNAAANATAIAFTDDLTAALSGLTATGLPMNDVCGAGSQISGTTNLSFTGGTLIPAGSCTFSVSLQVPMAAPPGNHTNTTSNVVATVSGMTTTGNAAQDNLAITGLNLVKSFTDDPAVPGGIVTLEFTINNTTATSNATSIIFTDDLGTVLTGLLPTAGVLPLIDICGSGSSLALISGDTLIFSGGNLTAGSSCTFSLTLDVPGGAADGIYNNSTSNLTADIDGSPFVLDPASDPLTVSSRLLLLTKGFTDDPVGPGDPVTLEFTLTNLDAAQAASAISFTDDLDAALSGLAATGLPINDVCGTGSQISGTSVLNFTGGNLPAGGSCTFSVTLTVPSAVLLGTRAVNTSSQVTGTIGGLAVTGDPAIDTLQIDSLSFTKAFSAAADPGGTVDLSFTLDNLDTVSVSSLAFSDDLDSVVAGLVATGLPINDVCGAGSQLAGTSFLTLTGGDLLPGGSCTFNVTLQVPGTATGGSYLNTTSDVTSAGIPVGSPATDTLTVNAPPPPAFSKAFAPATIVQGAGSTLTFTIDNTASLMQATALDFTDNMPAVITVASPANATTTCVGGTLTAVAGTNVISYSGGSVAAGNSCTVQVDVTSASVGTFVNTTGNLTSSAGNSGTATASLTVTLTPAPGFSKVFAPASIVQGETSTLSFTIDHSASLVMASSLDFTDTMPAAVTVASLPNASTTCVGGTLTAVAGTNVISYSGGSVAAGNSCTVQVDVTSASVGAHVNTSGNLTSSAGSSGTATASLAVTLTPVPGFSKVFTPASILQGGISTLIFTIDHSASLVMASSLDFTDTMPAALTVDSPANASTSCVGGTLTAVAGTNVISYSGGSVAAGSSCTVQVNVTSATVGTHVNTSGNLTSSAGSSGTATASLTITSSGPPDSDGDGVPDARDGCPDTVVPESVPTISQYAGRYALVDGDRVFDTVTSPWRPTPSATYTLDDTAGCSCEQIIAVLGLGPIHTQYGCGQLEMDNWVAAQVPIQRTKK